MKNPLLWVAGAAATLVAVAFSKKASAQGAEPAFLPCSEPAPSGFPRVPAGFGNHKGKISFTASTMASEALSRELGDFQTFVDEDGETRGILVTWHCHNPGEGPPVGWHKGATLLDRTA